MNKTPEIPINILYNDEQLLDFALHYLSIKSNDDPDVHPVADKIVITYIIRQYKKEGKDNFTEQDVVYDMSKLLADYIVTKLVEKNLVEVQFDKKGNTIYKNVDLEGLV